MIDATMAWSSSRNAWKCLILLAMMMGRISAIQTWRQGSLLGGPRETIFKLRGGDLGPITGKTLATTLSALAGSDAICGALIPRTSMGWFGIYIPKESLSNKYLHGIGASAATVAVSLYFAVTGTPVEKAIAYGFAARLVSMTLMILSDDEKKVGMNFSIFGVMWLTLAATVYTLLAGFGNPLTLTKVVSLVLGVHGLFLHTYPGLVLRTTNIAVGPDPIAKEILSIDGGYMMASGVTTFLLAQKLDPVKVAGITALSYFPVMHKVLEVVEAQMGWGVSTSFFAGAVTVLMACIVVGTLH